MLHDGRHVLKVLAAGTVAALGPCLLNPCIHGHRLQLCNWNDGLDPVYQQSFCALTLTLSVTCNGPHLSSLTESWGDGFSAKLYLLYNWQSLSNEVHSCPESRKSPNNPMVDAEASSRTYGSCTAFVDVTTDASDVRD